MAPLERLQSTAEQPLVSSEWGMFLYRTWLASMHLFKGVPLLLNVNAAGTAAASPSHGDDGVNERHNKLERRGRFR